MNSKSNFLIPAILVAGMAMPDGAAIAADEHAAHHPASDAATTPPADGMTHMQKMREQMATIRATKDPGERARLLDEHMQSMQSTMQQMHQGNGCMMMGDKAMLGGQGTGSMNMMQMMMEQMQQHQEAMRAAGK